MEYRVLARKYRPSNFDDLIGQEALVQTLSNAIKTGRIAHAFLLTGIRGVGKTTTARIIARALNCVGPDGQGGPTISPCGVCPNCVMISEDRHVDVLEMDAASHTGVDDIRSLIDTVRYLPSSARYKIYIIDEVHMLSNNAFNALLKTLEEPPPHVKFIFATTEARKIPVTILSRCQRFDLKRIGMDTLVAHLGRIAANEQVAGEEEALKLIALAAEGSVRDALSLLDQAIARGESQVTSAVVRHMMGGADNTATFRLLETVLSGDVAGALANVREQYGAGVDPQLLLQDCLEMVHLVTRGKVAPQALEDVTLAPQDRDAAKKFAEKLPMPILARLWQMLLKGAGELRNAPNPLAALEMLMVRIAYAAQLPTPAEVIRSGGATGGAKPSAPAAEKSAPAAKPNLELVSAQQAVPAATAPLPTSFAEAVALFAQNREALLYSRLRQEVRLVSFAPGQIALKPMTSMPRDFTARVAQCLQQWTGQPWRVVISEEQGEPPLKEQEEGKKAEQVQQVSSHPLVAAALEQFPGAQVVGVKNNA